MRYKIYVNDEGWKLLNVKHSKEELISTMDGVLNSHIKDFIVVEYNSDTDSEFPIMCNEKEYLKFKQEEQNKVLKKLR